LRFEWREGTRGYNGTGLAEENKEADKIMLPQELFGFPVTEVGEGAFRGCRFLVEAVIPEGVTKIGDRAFYGCYALERIELPNSLQSVGDEVFYLCMAITSQTEFDNAYYLGNKNNPYVLLSVHKSREVDSCVIHRSTKFIDRGAFAECRTLERIEIPNGARRSITVPRSQASAWGAGSSISARVRFTVARRFAAHGLRARARRGKGSRSKKTTSLFFRPRCFLDGCRKYQKRPFECLTDFP